ncbi:MAG: hypothetical protein ACO3JL_07395 [Myxococcota bacterium]
MNFRRTAPSVLLGLTLLPTTAGCELIELLTMQSFEIPVDLETPATELSVTEQIASAEARLCADEASDDCAVLKALYLTDDNAVSDPPALPAEFPLSVDIVDPTTGESETIDVAEWLTTAGIGQDIEVQQTIPMDLTTLVGVEDPSAIEDLRVSNVVINWLSNSFTFDTIPLELYIGSGLPEEGADAASLVASGAVTKVGTVPAQAADTAGEAPISFVEGGNAIFNEALRSLKFTAVLAFPPGTQVNLNEGSAPNLRRKPTGDAEVALKATLVYTVSAAKLAEQAQAAGEAAQ